MEKNKTNKKVSKKIVNRNNTVYLKAVYGNKIKIIRCTDEVIRKRGIKKDSKMGFNEGTKVKGAPQQVWYRVTKIERIALPGKPLIG